MQLWKGLLKTNMTTDDAIAHTELL